MTEFSCFLHPRVKAHGLDTPCPTCQRPMRHPLDQMPSNINGRIVVAAIDRGFYSAVYRVRHERTGIESAIKVTPVQVYEAEDPRDPLKGGYGGAKSFEEEAEIHRDLSDAPEIAGLEEWGEEDLTFGDVTVPCHWMRMRFVEGRTLRSVVEQGCRTPREALQIALDLLSLVDRLQTRGLSHNDLHAGNAVVETLERANMRRDAVAPDIQLRVFDLGSAGREDKSRPGPLEQGGRLDDREQIAAHILSMLDHYEANGLTGDPVDQRLSAQLRNIAELWQKQDRHENRLPEAQDFIARLRGALRSAERPTQNEPGLESFGLHHNALTLPPALARALLHDPDNWAERLSAPGPQMLAGMRGCGKTMLLRSLEWSARMVQDPDESREQRAERLRGEREIGLFVSCASLLRAGRAGTVPHPLQHLFLCFAREVVRALDLFEIDGTGDIRYWELEHFNRLLADVVSWHKPAENPTHLAELEHSISATLRLQAPEVLHREFDAKDAFEQLAELTCRLVDVWAGKLVLFLLDDVSVRFLQEEQLEHLFSQLCLKSNNFGFKISTEARSQVLSTPGGAAAHEGRDYENLDIGTWVLDRLRGPQGVDFIEGILSLRLQKAGLSHVSPKKLLGSQALTELARSLQRGDNPSYWGVQALAAVCVGNIGDVISMFDEMIRRLEQRPQGLAVLSKQVQHDVLTRASERRLASIAAREPLSYAHAVSFAAASSRELRASDPARPRQYTQVYVRVEPEHKDQLQALLKLIDEGVYVFAGTSERRKHDDDAPELQFKLAFNKILGIARGIPLSLRDRFEPAGDDVPTWLAHPTADLLSPVPPDMTPDPDEVETPPADDTASGGIRTDETSGAKEQATQAHKSPAPNDPQPQAAQLSMFDQQPDGPMLHVALTATAYQVPMDGLDWSNSTVVAAAGFEDRSLGAWEALYGRGIQPAAVHLLQYQDPGLSEQILGLLGEHGAHVSCAKAAERDELEAELQIPGAPDRQVVLDVTSLTKPLIFSLVRDLLRRDREVHILHTSAANYFPSDDDLEPVLRAFDQQEFASAFEQLDAITSGEGSDFVARPIGPLTRDPSQASFLALFTSLKLSRLKVLLDNVHIEQMAALTSRHESPDRALRNRVMEYVADALRSPSNGSRRALSTMEPADTFNALRELHARHALAGSLNFEITLTGSKMQAAGAGMFAATASPAGVFYAEPATGSRNTNRFTVGTGLTRLFRLTLLPDRPTI